MKKIYTLFIISVFSFCFSWAQKPVANFSASQDTTCAEFSNMFIDQSTNNPTSWKWSFQGGTPSTSSDQNPQNIVYWSQGSFDVKLVVINASGSDSITKNNVVIVYPLPMPITITYENDTLFCSKDSAFVSYQWYNGPDTIPGATQSYYVVKSCGSYAVAVANIVRCMIAEYAGSFNGYITCPNGIEDYSNENSISLFPNPSDEHLTIQTSSLHTKEVVIISILNTLGEIMQEEKLKWSEDASINIKNLPAGIYFLQLKSESGSVVKKFVKE